MNGNFWQDYFTTLIGWIAACLSGWGGKALLDWWIAQRKASLEKHRHRLESDVALMQIIDERLKTIIDDDDKTIARLHSELKATQLRLDIQQKLFTAIWSYVDTLINGLTDAGIKVPPRPRALSSGAEICPGGE